MTRYILVLLVVVFNSTCASSNMASSEKNMEEMIRSGEDLYFENQTFSEDIDFTKILKPNLISDGIYQVRIISSMTFKNCTFKGKVTFYRRDEKGITLTSFQSNLSFIGCTFDEDVSFRAASIMGRTDFTGTAFTATSNFEECTFFQNAYFRKTTYHKELRFHNAFFMQKANFLDAEFDVTASFQGTTFNSEAQFSNTQFGGYADFSLVNWNRNCFFNFAKFLDRSIFNNAEFRSAASFFNVEFNYSEIMGCSFFGKVGFNESVVLEKIILDKSKFLLKIPDLSSFDADKVSQVAMGKF